MVNRIGKERGHLTPVYDHPGQKGWGQKSLKGRRMAYIAFFAVLEYISPTRGNAIWTTRGAHSSESQGTWSLGRQARCQAGTERLSRSLPTFLSAPAKEGIKKKELVKSHTSFRSNFYPVSLWKSLEQAQRFTAEAANLPGKVPVFNKLFWLEFKGKVKISVGLAIENMVQTCNPISDETKNVYCVKNWRFLRNIGIRIALVPLKSIAKSLIISNGNTCN